MRHTENHIVNKSFRLKTFEELGVSEQIRRAIEELGFVSPMPVQEEVIPHLLENSEQDLIALAQTGTGKTAAFGLPLLQRLDADNKATQALVLSPTRELCLQITDDLRDFSKYMPQVRVVPVYGGTDIMLQIKALQRGAQIIVATPGRLLDLMGRGKVRLEEVHNVVLDEADEMLNMGFSESINAIFEGIPADRNTLLFSATMSQEIEKIALNYLHNHKEIVVGSRNEGAENVNHVYYMVNAKDKYLALKRIVDYYPKIFAIIFCRTKMETQEIADKLIKDGYNAEALHGDLSQQQRDLTMQKFRQHTVQLLVATDVAARGLDVDDLTHVINFGLPDDIENYTHRSGRTGRAGKKGTSISIVHSREKHKIRAIEREIGKNFVEADMPSAQEICKKQLYKVMDQILKTDVDEEQIAPFMADISRYFEYIDKEDLIKKIVSLEFGKFLAYYASAPEIEKPKERGKGKEDRGERRDRRGERNSRGRRPTETGYTRLFINLGKDDGFYPGEVMQFINKNVQGRQAVGHIDLLGRYSYIEVPSEDARKVMKALNGANYKGRDVRCNEADEPMKSGKRRENSAERRTERGKRSVADKYPKDFTGGRKKAAKKAAKEEDFFDENGQKYDWRELMNAGNPTLKKKKNKKTLDLIGEEPDFSEEGWARRKPKKQ